jgi:hypothetical protein
MLLVFRLLGLGHRFVEVTNESAGVQEDVLRFNESQ